jgi:hypothetical protein
MTAQNLNISGDVSFNQNEGQIIADALQMLGVLGGGVSTSTNDMNFCSNMLNKMIKSWQAQGIQLFTETEAVIPLTAAVSIYALSATGIEQSTYPELTVAGRPLNINSLRYQYYQGSEIRLKKFGRAQFMEVPNKTTGGPSTCYYFSPQDTYGLLYLWPVPDNALDTINISYTRVVQSMDSSTNTPDLPVEALHCITLNLACLVAPAFGISLQKTMPELPEMAKLALAELKSWDSEEGSVFIVPDYRWDR